MEHLNFKTPAERKYGKPLEGKFFKEPSETIDDICLTPQEILMKYTTGEPVPIKPYDKEFNIPNDNYENLINDTDGKDFENDL